MLFLTMISLYISDKIYIYTSSCTLHIYELKDDASTILTPSFHATFSPNIPYVNNNVRMYMYTLLPKFV